MGQLTDRSYEELVAEKTNSPHRSAWGREGKLSDVDKFIPRGQRSVIHTIAELKRSACITQHNVWRVRLSPAAWVCFQVEAERDGRWDHHFDTFEEPLRHIWGTQVIEDPGSFWVDRDLTKKMVWGDE